MTPRFKEGDIVRVVSRSRDYWHGFPIGLLCKVHNFNADDDTYKLFSLDKTVSPPIQYLLECDIEPLVKSNKGNKPSSLILKEHENS